MLPYVLMLVFILFLCWLMLRKQDRMYKRLTPEELEDYQRGVINHIEELIRGYEKDMKDNFEEYENKINELKNTTDEDLSELLHKGEVLKFQLDEKVEKIKEFKKMAKI